jgi:hypothetical protein
VSLFTHEHPTQDLAPASSAHCMLSLCPRVLLHVNLCRRRARPPRQGNAINEAASRIHEFSSPVSTPLVATSSTPYEGDRRLRFLPHCSSLQQQRRWFDNRATREYGNWHSKSHTHTVASSTVFGAWTSASFFPSCAAHAPPVPVPVVVIIAHVARQCGLEHHHWYANMQSNSLQRPEVPTALAQRRRHG